MLVSVSVGFGVLVYAGSWEALAAETATIVYRPADMLTGLEIYNDRLATLATSDYPTAIHEKLAAGPEPSASSLHRLQSRMIDVDKVKINKPTLLFRTLKRTFCYRNGNQSHFHALPRGRLIVNYLASRLAEQVRAPRSPVIY